MKLETNNRPHLVSAEMKNYLHSKGIHLAKSAIYWTRGNGEVYRYNQTLVLGEIGA